MENQIVTKIIEDAETTAAEMVEGAKALAAARVLEVEKRLEQGKADTIEREKARVAAEITRREHLAKSLERREKLARTQEAITQIFEGVAKGLSSGSDKDFQKLVSGLVSRFGKDGDTVIVAKADEKRLSDAFFKTLKVKNLKRVVSDKISSGIILENNISETRLTLDEILAELREKLELELSEQLA